MPPKKISLIKSVTVNSDDVDIIDTVKKISKKITLKKKDKVEDKDEARELEGMKPSDEAIDKGARGDEAIDNGTRGDEAIDKGARGDEAIDKGARGAETLELKPSQNNSLKPNLLFDMFGEKNTDYRNSIMNYDYTKNKTPAKITKYEIALIIGKRAKQLECGANANIKFIVGQTPIEIAEEELRQRVIPFFIKRQIGNSYELYKLSDMECFLD